jgi:ligand-binding SRPBCC domain-containing protein
MADTRQWRKLKEETAIDSSPAAVWEVLRAFGDVARWAPGIAWSSCLDDPPEGIGARRLMRHQWGFRLEEVVTAWDEGRGFTFLVKRAPFPLNFVLETWTVAESGGRARVETTVEYNTHIGIIGRLIDQVLVRHLIRREMRRGLAGLRSCVTAE